MPVAARVRATVVVALLAAGGAACDQQQQVTRSTLNSPATGFGSYEEPGEGNRFAEDGEPTGSSGADGR